MTATFLRRAPVVAALAALTGLAACGDQTAASAADPNLYTVVRRDLPITVKENAELQALRETVVRSQLEGQATIIFLIPEGATVKQGDKLVELDSSDLVDKRANQAITVAKAEALLAQALKSLEILQKELVANRNTAESNLRIAEMEFEKFMGRKASGQKGSQGRNRDMVRKLQELVSAPPAVAAADAISGDAQNLVSQVDPRNYSGLVAKASELLQNTPTGTGDPLDRETDDPLDREMGEMANKVLQQVDQIRLAMGELKVKEDTYGHSRRLAQKQFITRNELERDELAFQSQMSKVTLAWNDLDLLVNYTLFKQRIELAQNVDNAKLELERVLASNQAEETRADSDLRSKQAEYDLAKGRLDNLEKQILNAAIFAPTPGLVVYARLERDRRSSESVREGVSVRERQDLIILPDTSRMTAIVKVQEAVIDQVTLGQRAHITVEAFPERIFTGRVTRVAPVADSNSGWMTSDRKVYTTTVELDGENPESVLRSRMAAGVTILIDELKNVLSVPLQAIRRDRAVNYIWKQTPQGPKAMAVDVGPHNAEQVSLPSGLQEGDRIYLTPPPGAAVPSFPQPAVAAPMGDLPGNGADPGPDNGTVGADGSEAGPGSGGRRGRGERGEGRGPGGMGNLTPEMQEQFAELRRTNDEIKAWLLQKYPERQAEIQDRRGMSSMLEEPEVRDALEAEQPDLFQKQEATRRLMEQFRGGGGRPGGASNSGGPGGGRTGGDGDGPTRGRGNG